MQKTRKKSSRGVAPVRKPFLRGTPLDATTTKSILLVFIATLGMAFGLMLFGGMMMWETMFFRYLINGLLLVAVYAIFFYTGASRGTLAVSQGEILFRRKEQNLPVNDKEQSICYHPMKGWLIGLLGCLPMVLCGILLAVIAQPQMTSYGAMPSWTNSLLKTEEIGSALSYYQKSEPLGLEQILRLIVRMNLMPYVNIIGAENSSALLLLERLSAFLLIVPGVFYGIGYMQGERMRSRVHTDIAISKKKRARKAQKQQKKKRQMQGQMKEPERLN